MKGKRHQLYIDEDKSRNCSCSRRNQDALSGVSLNPRLCFRFPPSNANRSMCLYSTHSAIGAYLRTYPLNTYNKLHIKNKNKYSRYEKSIVPLQEKKGQRLPLPGYFLYGMLCRAAIVIKNHLKKTHCH